jgi:hypothetical protein
MKYKVLKSVAHNFGDSFVGGLNFDKECKDLISYHLGRVAIASNRNELEVNLLTGAASPPEMLVPEIRDSIDRYLFKFPELLGKHGVTLSAIKSATMRITFYPYKKERAWNGWLGMPYDCVVELVDDRDKKHIGRVHQLWFDFKVQKFGNRVKKWLFKNFKVAV